MWLRRLFYRWMFPAAVALPLWLLIGWIVFRADGWALLWVLLLAMPSVFVGQLVLALLVRARASVRIERAVSWWDVAGFAVWHVLVVATGVFSPVWFAPALVGAVAAAVGLFWLTLAQLWREMRQGVTAVLHTAEGAAYIPPQRPTTQHPAGTPVFVIAEQGRQSHSR